MASQYLHEGQQKTSDSLINIVVTKFPNGSYQKKKNENQIKQSNQDEQLGNYKAFYFESQIGNWQKMNEMAKAYESKMSISKWYTPFQFLKVKMYAQQKQDQPALLILDAIIANNKNDIIREKAKEIITEIKNRKETEAYLNRFESNKSIITQQPSTLAASASESLHFMNDSLEKHYLSIAINDIGIDESKRLQNAFLQTIKLDPAFINLIATFSSFEKASTLFWVGPFDNKKAAIQYLNLQKTKLTDQISLINPKHQYEIYIFGKSNISLIASPEALKLYKDFMFNKIYKP